jgi:putative ABC transport system permease protein
VTWPAVSSDYLSTMGIPLRDGRFLRDHEEELVAVVSESAARMLWPGMNPIGRKVSRDEKAGPWLRVVGVVGDVLSAGLDRVPTPAIYRSYSQYGPNAFSVVVRTSGAPESKAAAVRSSVSSVDPEIPVANVRSMSAVIGKSAEQRRFQTELLTAFAIVAVVLAAIGVYGVVASSTLQRRKEIGVRMALGANANDVIRLVLRGGMAPVVFGLVTGVAMAMLLAEGMASLLFGVSTTDPMTLAAAPMVLAAAGALPCWMIARRAAGIPPAESLSID